MKASVREFKAQLSVYLQRASNGEEVVITSRGRPIARLLAVAPAAGPAPSDAEIERRIKRIPGILPSQGGKPRGSSRPMVIRRGQKTLAQLVLEDRE